MEGYIEYQRREYCNDIRCPVQLRLNAVESNSEAYQRIRQACLSDCLHTTYEFHHWLIDKGYLLVRPEE